MKSKNQQQFLSTFFEGDSYQEKEVNGFVLVKHWNGGAKIWQVAVYTKESFQRSKEGYQKLQQYKYKEELNQDFKNRIEAENT